MTNEESKQESFMMARMLKVLKHRRECHVTGHRGCPKCTPDNCQDCKKENKEFHVHQARRIDRMASHSLATNGFSPTNAKAYGRKA